MLLRVVFMALTTVALTACLSGPSLDVHVAAPVPSGSVEVVVPAGYVAHRTISCSGTDTIRLDNAYIEAAGVAVRAQDACTITLVNSQIISHAGIALVADGAGDVELIDCYVQGAHGAVEVSGAGDVNARGGTIIGAVFVGDAGAFNPSPDTVVRTR